MTLWAIVVFSVCRLTEHIKRELRHRSGIEPVIGHLKSEQRMGRNHLALA